MANIENEYLVKRGNNDFATIASLFSGVRILKMDGFLAKGKPINIYTAQWVNNQAEDYMVTDVVSINGVEYDAVFRENVDIDVTFVVGDKYGASDVRAEHDAFVAYMTDGALFLKSNYADRVLRCVCLKEYAPTTKKLKRPSGKNYIIGTITLHSLDSQAGGDDGYIDNPYPTPRQDDVQVTMFSAPQTRTIKSSETVLRMPKLIGDNDAQNQSYISVGVSGTTLMITTT